MASAGSRVFVLGGLGGELSDSAESTDCQQIHVLETSKLPIVIPGVAIADRRLRTYHVSHDEYFTARAASTTHQSPAVSRSYSSTRVARQNSAIQPPLQ